MSKPTIEQMFVKAKQEIFNGGNYEYYHFKCHHFSGLVNFIVTEKCTEIPTVDLQGTL